MPFCWFCHDAAQFCFYPPEAREYRVLKNVLLMLSLWEKTVNRSQGSATVKATYPLEVVFFEYGGSYMSARVLLHLVNYIGEI